MNWFLVILAFSSFQGILLCGLLIYKKWHKQSVGQALLLLLITISFGLVMRLVSPLGFYGKYPHVVQAGDLAILLFGPIFWHFSRSLMAPEASMFRKREVIHLIPGLLFILHFLFFLLPVGPAEFIQIENSGGFDTYYIILLSSGIASNIYYIIRSYRLYSRSDKTSRLSGLLHTIIILNGVTCLLWLIGHVFSIFVPQLANLINIVYQLAFITFSLTTIVVSIKALANSGFLNNEGHAKIKYATSSLSLLERHRINSALEKYISEAKPYLNSKLSLEMLSNALDVNKVYLSRVINEHYGMNFFDYFNQLRIEEFIKRVESGNYEHLTFFGIASDSGFNTKPTFNKAFKKNKGMTPSQYFYNHAFSLKHPVT